MLNGSGRAGGGRKVRNGDPRSNTPALRRRLGFSFARRRKALTATIRGWRGDRLPEWGKDPEPTRRRENAAVSGTNLPQTTFFRHGRNGAEASRTPCPPRLCRRRRIWRVRRAMRLMIATPAGILKRFPIAWNHAVNKKSLNFNDLEHVLIENVSQLFYNAL